jgi:hypothetical protein
MQPGSRFVLSTVAEAAAGVQGTSWGHLIPLLLGRSYCFVAAVAARAALLLLLAAGRPPLGVQSRQLALQLVLLELHAVLELEAALEVVEARRRRDVQQLFLNSTRLEHSNNSNRSQQ